MTLGAIIKKYREENELSMDDFSKKSGISKAYIGFLEKNYNPKTGKTIAPSVAIIKQAADGMRMDFDSLFSMLDKDFPIHLSNSVPERLGEYRKRLSEMSLKIADAYEKADDRTRIAVEVALGIGGER